MTLPTTLDGWLAHCERLHTKTIDMGLERLAVVRDRLGLRFHMPVITVAGTNGKGSTCAMLESVALQSGYRVGLYIKPHLVHFTERCRVNGEPVAGEALLPHFEAVEAARGDTPLTWFEYTTLAIMRLLSQAPLDLVILEVGMGGRLDAVNVVDPDCAVITSIALDHMEFLGPDREAIGREKAGIMRPGRPVVVSDPEPPASVLARAEDWVAKVICVRPARRAASITVTTDWWRAAASALMMTTVSLPAFAPSLSATTRASMLRPATGVLLTM